MKLILNIVSFLAIPLFSIMITNWYIADLDSEFESEFGLSATEICTLDDIEIQEICAETFYGVRLLNDAAFYTSIVAVALILSFVVISKLCGTNRKLIAFVFPKYVPVFLLGLAGLVLVQGAMLTYVTYWVQILLMDAWFPILTLGMGFGAFVASMGVLAAVWASLTSREHTIFIGKQLFREDSPKLFSAVEEIANQISAAPPENIVVGLDPTFYVLNNPVKLTSEGRTITGETLYLSLPLLRILSHQELRAVIGHELGHFVGKDVDYSRKFSPVYSAISNSHSQLVHSNRLTALPAEFTIGNLLDVFDKNVKLISRERELIADQFGAKASSGESLTIALLKLGIYSSSYNYVIKEIINRIKNGLGFTQNISWLFQSVVEHNVSEDSVLDAVRVSSSSSVSHPNDSHPTTAARAESLEVKISEIPKEEFLIPSLASSSLVDNMLEIEEELTILQQHLFKAMGVQEGEATDSDILQKITSMIAAHITVADGRIDKSEIKVAEGIGMAMFKDFDYFGYREYCHYPNSLLSIEKLLEISSNFDDELKNLIHQMCVDISTADGDSSAEELAIIHDLKVSFNLGN